MNSSEDNYNYAQFRQDAKAGQVVGITMKQNKEVPTGTMTVELKNEVYKNCNITDVDAAVKEIENKYPNLYKKMVVKPIDRSGDWITTLLPNLLMEPCQDGKSGRPQSYI